MRMNAGNHDRVLLKWPPRSPDLTPSDFFIWGYEKGLVYLPPLPTNVVEFEAALRMLSAVYSENWRDATKRDKLYYLEKKRIVNSNFNAALFHE